MASLKEAIENVAVTAMRCTSSISRVEDSAALAVYIRTKYPAEIYKCAEYVFCDTQCELEETYEYLKLKTILGKPVQRPLNALELLDIRDKPDAIRSISFFVNSLRILAKPAKPLVHTCPEN